MTRRTLAWALAGAGVALQLAALCFVLAGIGTATPGDAFASTPDGTAFWISFFAFPLIGGVIASRRPENAIGWLFLGIGIASGLTSAGLTYADYALFLDPGRLPGAEWIAWAAFLFDVVGYVGMLVLAMLFPDGRLPSRRWRPVLAGLVLGAASMSVARAVTPGPLLDEKVPIPNPVSFGSADTVRTVFETIGGLFLVPCALLACLCALLRFRRARGVERQQFKWFALGVCFLLGTFVFGTLAFGDSAAVRVFTGIAFAALPLSVGVAILRHRLYDIDHVISRTLVYGALTVILGAAYAALVLAGQALFSSFAGGSDLAIAGSTLVVAALFLPARSRVQRFVDRRFYRRRYDAQRTLAAFGNRVREQVELDGLRADLEGVVHETMQPAHASVWLRGTT